MELGVFWMRVFELGGDREGRKRMRKKSATPARKKPSQNSPPSNCAFNRRCRGCRQPPLSFSAPEKHLKNYVDIYPSLKLNSIICQAQILNLFCPDKAASLAQEIVNELIQIERKDVQPSFIFFL
ncbi:hypothetical protein AAHA92_04768 [Salvia divinorum]|uniref:Uncharacterized protein n=1 Tax=Salvia divinorum TaxID=28513 RepID=A0ABD1I1K6_SALDI